jgi:hypothetical protein
LLNIEVKVTPQLIAQVIEEFDGTACEGLSCISCPLNKTVKYGDEKINACLAISRIANEMCTS